MTPDGGELLDAAARAVFDSVDGRARLAPLLASFDAAVGRFLEDDAPRDLLLAIRLDWALCDATPSDARDAADTWLRRAAAGELPDVPPDPAWEPLLATHASVFEVWPTSDGAFLRDIVRGVCLPLVEPMGLHPAPRGPAAVWDARLIVTSDGARLCRAPLLYPLDVLTLLHRYATATFEAAFEPATCVLPLRRAWLAVHRQPRLAPERAFRTALAGWGNAASSS